MGANVEIKARLADRVGVAEVVGELSGGSAEVLEQEDTFFGVEQGRLKLRVFPGGVGELIQYHRSDDEGPTRSDYHIHRTNDPSSLRVALSAALGIRGVVRKTRHLYLIGQTRVHLDAVDDLGDFLELEVVLRPDQPTADGERIAHELMTKLSIAEADLVDLAYVDLLEAKSTQT